ncbi:MAG: alpha/beta hydrolase [Lachnospiraceae bacterium]|nr:alpha/beta hydrolase [Lachnospiraceae bacterium]
MVALIVLLTLVVTASVFIVYDVCFSARQKYMCGNYSFPKGEQFEPYHDVIRKGVDQVLEVMGEQVYITSFDGVKLAGKYYHLKDNAPLVIFFHGYRCSSLRDGNGIFLYSRKKGYNVLMIDNRAHGLSEGRCITFGIKERFDVLHWVNYAVERFGKEQKILLAGLSMGAATVLMSADVGLPQNVKGIMADCPYSSPKEILCTVMKQLKMPVKLTYWIAKFSAKYIGKFDLEETSALEAVKHTKIPILILHGDDDRFVPCSMSEDCQKIAKDYVELVLIKGAGHGMSHCVDGKTYENAVEKFFQKTLGEEKKHGNSI